MTEHPRATQAARLLRYARRRAGLTQRALAERAGVPQPAIARIERGVLSPRLAPLSHLLDAAGATLEVAPRAGIGVDRSLIRASLERTPENRILAAGAAGRNVGALLEQARRGRRH